MNMTIDDIVTLTKAGFTKEEIIKLSATQPQVSSTAPAPEQPESISASPAPAPEPVKVTQPVTEQDVIKPEDLGAVIEQKIGEAFKPFENLYNQIAIKANMPTIGAIEPKGIEDIVNDFFTK